jgi:hypothetical protein
VVGSVDVLLLLQFLVSVEGTLELTCLTLEGKWLLDLSNSGLKLCRHTSFGHKLLLNVLLTSTFHPIANFIHPANLVDLVFLQVFLQVLVMFLAKDLRFKAEILLAAFVFVIFLSFFSTLTEPSPVFSGIQINAAISM